MDADEQRRAAAAAERAGEWDQAVQLWDAIPESGDTLRFWDRHRAANAALRARRPADALARLESLQPPAEGEGACAELRAGILEQTGDDAQAIAWWRKAADLQREPYWALFGLARSLSRTGLFAEAEAVVARALARPRAEASGARFAASLAFRDGRFEQGDLLLARFGLEGPQRTELVMHAMPGMTTEAERLAMYDIGRRRLIGAGEIVDLGCWLGSLTVALALGTHDNPHPEVSRRHIHAYDQFVWMPLMDTAWRNAFESPPPARGDSFLPVFDRLTRPWRDRIAVHPGDLLDERWTGGPIELLSIDAMKSAELAAHVIAEFFPSLIPEGSWILHQDFCHSPTWWIHLYHFLLRDHFSAPEPLERSEGVVFRAVRAIDPATVSRVLDADLTDAGLAAEAFAFTMQQVADEQRGAVAIAHARCDARNGRIERARAIAEAYRDDPAARRELRRFPLPV